MTTYDLNFFPHEYSDLIEIIRFINENINTLTDNNMLEYLSLIKYLPTDIIDKIFSINIKSRKKLQSQLKHEI